MIKLYVNGTEVDFFEDESIKIVKTIKNLTDISKVFSTFSQGFTVPASNRNNAIFQHFYRDDILTTSTSFKRLEAYITLNDILFESGGVQIEGASIKNGIPTDYKLGFFGNTSKLKELVGDNTLADLDLTAYDHFYTSEDILEGFGDTSTGATISRNSGAVIYPLFSPVKNWEYDSGANHTDNNIAFHGDHGANFHGVNYYELKPALQVTKILDAIEAEYGITFDGSFITTAPFDALFLWLNNREGYTFEGVDAGVNYEIVKEPIFNVTHSVASSAIESVGTKMLFRTKNFNTSTVFRYDIEFTTLSDDCFLEMYVNNTLWQREKYTATGVTNIFYTPAMVTGSRSDIRFKVVKTTASLTIALEYTLYFFPSNPVVGIGPILTTAGTGAQSSTTYTESVVMANLIPKIKITDFLNGLIKMHNLIVTSTDGETYTLTPYDTYYSAGEELDLSRWLDTSDVQVEEIARYSSLSFKYQESDQVLQKQFRQNSGRGYGDLVQRFNFDSAQDFTVELPFDQVFPEVLNDLDDGSPVNFPIYKSIQVDEAGVSSSYYGSPILFYLGGTLDITANPISFVDESNAETRINLINYCNTISRQSNPADDTCFSEEINPSLLDKADDNLYTNYWTNFINNTYAQQVRLFKISAYLNGGVLTRLNLNDIIVWKGRKYVINQMNIDGKTGKVDLQLITKI
jgi:hypothetical protein